MTEFYRKTLHVTPSHKSSWIPGRYGTSIEEGFRRLVQYFDLGYEIEKIETRRGLFANCPSDELTYSIHIRKEYNRKKR